MTLTLPGPPALPRDRAGIGRISLFLDFDGTLVDIATRHDGVVVDAALRRLVALLAARLDGRLAVVSGRPVAEIAAYLHVGAAQPPPFAIAGSHGLELQWPDGRRQAPPAPAGLEAARAAFEALAERCPGVVVEPKPFGVALHFRQAPEAEAACIALASDVAQQAGLFIQHGKMVCELRAPGADKGDALHHFLSAPLMAGTLPFFAGDDLTDEAGFVAAEALGGAGILVGPPRPTAARYGLAGVAAVHAWLSPLADRCLEDAT